MRTTIELPDELLAQAKQQATRLGISLSQFFVESAQPKLAPAARKVRRDPPCLGEPNAPRIGVLTPEQIDRSLFG